MKTIKFAPSLISGVLTGKKKVTWRLFDDKNLAVGDELVFKNRENLEDFARAKVTSVKVKKLRDVSDKDLLPGYEPYADHEVMMADFRHYYGNDISDQTEVKMVAFELI
tara:strand:- start:174 stop:500 length:327 start_codon:yes stop_codon:yes gene_type:complete